MFAWCEVCKNHCKPPQTKWCKHDTSDICGWVPDMETIVNCLWFDELADVALMAKTWKWQKHDPCHGCLAPGSENFGLPHQQKKSKKVHRRLLQFVVKVICNMLHVCMVWGLQILSNTSTRKSVKKHNLLLMKVYSETDTHASGWWCVPWNSTKESLQMAPSHCSPHSSVVKFQWVVPMNWCMSKLWRCWGMHSLVGFGAPPWVSDIAGSTNFV